MQSGASETSKRAARWRGARLLERASHDLSRVLVQTRKCRSSGCRLPPGSRFGEAERSRSAIAFGALPAMVAQHGRKRGESRAEGGKEEESARAAAVL